MNPIFNQDEQQRYARHFSVQEIGLPGQAKLKAAKVLLIGAGGIGAPVALYLASCGVGRLGIIDDDRVDLSNLQRQVLFNTEQCGQSKAACAKERVLALNPNIEVTAYVERLTVHNAHTLITGYDIVVDGSDNYATRYLVGDVCAYLHKPLVSSSIYQFIGQLSIFNVGEGSVCYRCLYPSPPPAQLIPNCAEAGVSGIIPGILGTLAVNEVLKLILGIGVTLSGKLLTFDALSNEMVQYPIQRHPRCPICVAHRSFDQLPRYSDPVCAVKTSDITAAEVQSWLQQNKSMTLLDVRESWERALSHIEPSIHIPLGLLNEVPLNFSPADTVIIYCKSGIRSLHAAEILKQRGYPNVFNLKGGITGWGIL